MKDGMDGMMVLCPQGSWPVVLKLGLELAAIVLLPIGCSTGRVQAYRVQPNNNTLHCETMLALVTKSGMERWTRALESSWGHVNRMSSVIERIVSNSDGKI